MIKYIEKMGRHDRVLLAEFGSGDILAASARAGYYNKEPVPSLLLWNDPNPPSEIGTEHDTVGLSTDDIEAPFMFMSFHDAQSVDVLIDRLNQIKQMFGEDFRTHKPKPLKTA